MSHPQNLPSMQYFLEWCHQKDIRLNKQQVQLVAHIFDRDPQLLVEFSGVASGLTFVLTTLERYVKNR